MGGNSLDGFAILAILIGVYFAPSIVAARRGHRNKTPIFLLNLFLGWTLIGWVAALIWSTTAQD
jgi:hypothetical protein